MLIQRIGIANIVLQPSAMRDNQSQWKHLQLIKLNSMTDKVQKIREWVKARLGENNSKQSIPQFYGMMEEDARFLDFLDTMQEEPVSEELGDYINELSKQFPEVSFAKLSRIAVRVAKWQKEKEYTCYEEAFEDGAKWKEEQMMAKAVDAKLLEGHLIRQKGFTHPLYVGDKVKIIVIKEE